MRRAAVLVVLLLGAGLVAWLALRPGEQRPPRTQPAPRVSDHVVLTNAQGRWTVFTRCVPGVVGPGYVAKVVTRGGRVLVDDERGSGTLNDTDFGGLGAFGWHHSRGLPGRLRFAANNAWEESVRTCARANGRFGVTDARIVEHRPTSLTVDVALGDRFTYPEPLMRVRYRYDVEPTELRSTITVTELCSEGRCGRTKKIAFLKEPKLVLHTGAAFERVEVLDGGGRAVCSTGANGPAHGPILATTQCGDPSRTTVRFEPCTDACLEVTVGGWDEDSDGFDAWAVKAASRPPAFASDTGSVDGVLWPCHGGDPSSTTMRRWELAGRRGRSIGALLPAWEGGRGGYDCEPLARAFGPRGETWRALLAYSLVK